MIKYGVYTLLFQCQEFFSILESKMNLKFILN